MGSSNPGEASGSKRKPDEDHINIAAAGAGAGTSKVPRVLAHLPLCDSCLTRCGSDVQPKIGRTCLNFVNTGVPRRIMFYHRGEWSDFPDHVAQAIIDGFRAEKSCTKALLDDQPILVDLSSMTVINLTTMKQKSVAWIDEAKKCYFPSLFFDDDADQDDESAAGGGTPQVPAATQESSAAAAAAAPPAPAAEAGKQIVAVENNVVRPIPAIPRAAALDILRSRLTKAGMNTQSFLFVRNHFVAGMGPFGRFQDVVCVDKYVARDPTAKTRLQAFERQLRATRAKRGGSNVRYLWYGVKKEEVARIVVYGFAAAAKLTGAFGTGIYFVPGNRSFAAVNLCETDDKGLQYMLLCRVVLGNMEAVKPGSEQYRPGGDQFDSGVDHEENPRCHVVWASHANTYIHPEYIVGFKLLPHIRDYLFGLNDVPFDVFPTRDVPDFSTLPFTKCVSPKGANSPWVPFSAILPEVQRSVSPVAKELIYRHFQEFLAKALTRAQFVLKMRTIAGDPLMKYIMLKYLVEKKNEQSSVLTLN